MCHFFLVYQLIGFLGVPICSHNEPFLVADARFAVATLDWSWIFGSLHFYPMRTVRGYKGFLFWPWAKCNLWYPLLCFVWQDCLASWRFQSGSKWESCIFKEISLGTYEILVKEMWFSRDDIGLIWGWWGLIVGLIWGFKDWFFVWQGWLEVCVDQYVVWDGPQRRQTDWTLWLKKDWFWANLKRSLYLTH